MHTKPLPDEIDWAQDIVDASMLPAAFLRPQHRSHADQGSTRTWGLPDIPVGANWAVSPVGRHRHWNLMPWALGQSPYDGESFFLQLNLEEIPREVRKKEWPSEGVVWVILDLSRGCPEADAYFDPRPAKSIHWHPRLEEKVPEAAAWTLSAIAPDVTDRTLRELNGLEDVYLDWAQDQNCRARLSDVQVGGWIWPCQGWFDDRNKDFVCALLRQSFGDNGSIYLHYNTEQGFYALFDVN